MGKKPVTLTMLSDKLGVSVQTVSNALRRTGRVSEDVAERIRAEAEALGYRPNRGALALRGARTRTLALVVADEAMTHTPNAYVGYLVAHMSNAIREIGWAPHVHFSESLDPGKLLEPLDHGIADGAVLVVNKINEAQIRQFAGQERPLVLFERESGPGGLPFVAAEYAAGIEQAVRHVHSQGAQRIAYLDGRPHHQGTSSVRRYEGFVAGCAAVGCVPDLIFPGDWRFTSGLAAFEHFRAQGRLPDAVVCGNDHMAAGILHAAQKHGLSVPGDMMVTGFDDLEFAQYTLPEITSVRLPLAAMATAAARMAAALCEGQEVASAILPTELIIRASSQVAKG